MTKEECKCEQGPVWSRWIKRKNRKDKRQYRFCLNCFKVVYRNND